MGNTQKIFGDTSLVYSEQFAIFSCEETPIYRYVLSRTWDSSLPKMLTILLNPSTADQNNSAPTNTRGEVRAREYGYGTNIFCNLFAFRSPSPAIMKEHHAPIGPENDRILLEQVESADLVILGWGTHGTHQGRNKSVIKMIEKTGKQINVIRQTKDGHPEHILYLPYTLKPKPYAGKAPINAHCSDVNDH